MGADVYLVVAPLAELSNGELDALIAQPMLFRRRR